MKCYSPCDLPEQARRLKRDLDKARCRVFKSGVFVSGSETRQFEKAFARFVGARWAVGTSSGTDALRWALLGCGIGPGDEVITSAMTFVATAEAILQTGAQVVLVDIDPDTYCIDPRKIAKVITRRTRAILPVHLYGHPADLVTIQKIARKQKLAVIEDAAQAHGAMRSGRITGSSGRMSCFSFYPTKNLGAFGDGGMVMGSSKKDEEYVRRLINHGGLKRDEHRFVGHAARLDELQAAWLRVKLAYLNQWNKKRRALAHVYGVQLAGTRCVCPVTQKGARHVFHQYVIRCRRRDRVIRRLHADGVKVMVHYPRPVHLLPNMKSLKYQKGDFPISEELAATAVSLPIYPELSKRDVIEISRRVRKTLDR